MPIYELSEANPGELIYLHYKFGKLKSRGIAALVLEPASRHQWMQILIGEEVLQLRYTKDIKRPHDYELCNPKGQYLNAIDSIELLGDACN